MGNLNNIYWNSRSTNLKFSETDTTVSYSTKYQIIGKYSKKTFEKTYTFPSLLEYTERASPDPDVEEAVRVFTLNEQRIDTEVSRLFQLAHEKDFSKVMQFASNRK